jgi:hypothetical protein
MDGARQHGVLGETVEYEYLGAPLHGGNPNLECQIDLFLLINPGTQLRGMCAPSCPPKEEGGNYYGFFSCLLNGEYAKGN